MFVFCVREQSTNGLYKAKYTDIKQSFFFCHAEFTANPDIEENSVLYLHSVPFFYYSNKMALHIYSSCLNR